MQLVAVAIVRVPPKLPVEDCNKCPPLVFTLGGVPEGVTAQVSTYWAVPPMLTGSNPVARISSLPEVVLFERL